MTEHQLPNDEEIMRVLNANPQIKRRIASMLAVVQDAAGDLKEADAAETRLIEEIRVIVTRCVVAVERFYLYSRHSGGVSSWSPCGCCSQAWV
jgi:hypothetical protein